MFIGIAECMRNEISTPWLRAAWRLRLSLLRQLREYTVACIPQHLPADLYRQLAGPINLFTEIPSKMVLSLCTLWFIVGLLGNRKDLFVAVNTNLSKMFRLCFIYVICHLQKSC